MYRTIGIIFLIIIYSCSSQLGSKYSNSKREIKKIPINYNGNYITFEGTINDSIKGNFDFDTGGSVLYLDSLFFFNSNLPLKNFLPYKIRGFGTGFQNVKILQDTLLFKTGDLEYSATITPIMQLKDTQGKDIDGSLGMANLKEYVVELNYHKGFMRLYNPKNFIVNSEYTALPFKILKNRIIVNVGVQLNDSLYIQGDFLVDTGSPGVLSLTNSVAKEFNLDKNVNKRIFYYSDSYGVGGNSTGFCFRAESVKFSHFEINEPIITYSKDLIGGGAYNDNYIGLLGNGLLDKFDIVLDFSNNIMYINPNKNFAKPVNLSLRGFSYTDRTDITEGWIITVMLKGSNAEKAGLKLQDIIIQINGVSVKKINKKQQSKLFKKEGKNIKLLILRGNKEVMITYQLAKILE